MCPPLLAAGGRASYYVIEVFKQCKTFIVFRRNVKISFSEHEHQMEVKCAVSKGACFFGVVKGPGGLGN